MGPTRLAALVLGGRVGRREGEDQGFRLRMFGVQRLRKRFSRNSWGRGRNLRSSSMKGGHGRN
ncbi:hypothetical protein EJB05_05650, partial [Eragrostis curvula]